MTIPSAILSTESLLNNLKVIKALAPNKKVMVMLKANGYGHGIRSTALRLDGLVDYLGVARLDEAVALRKVGIKSNITVMQGVLSHEELLVALGYSFDLVVHDFFQLQLLESFLPGKINIWLKIDTGLGRLGFPPEMAGEIYQKLLSLQSVGSLVLFSHLAMADDKDHPLNDKQRKIFASLAKDFPGPKSLANSAALLNFPDSHYDIVRPGLALYGLSPIKGKTGKDFGLKPVMSLIASVISVRDLKEGATIGYGATFTTTKPSKIATVAIGYGDGYPRSAKNNTPFLIKNQLVPLVGRVSMDMLNLDVTELKGIKVGDFATCWSEDLPLEKITPLTNNSIYDILTAVQLRVKFYWK
jgi:alanine racemase